MNKRSFKVFSLITILALILMAVPMQSAGAAGTVSLTTIGSAYTQDFDTLVNSGTSSLVPTGWDFFESGTGANTTYAADNGTSNTGNTYSYGATSSTDRAFGGLLSGSLTPIIGASFTNNTGSTITQLDISYTGEQWRLGTLARAERIDFQYSTNATSLNSGTWTDIDPLDFTGPVTSGTVGALDGNTSPNRTTVSGNITGLSIPNGVSFWIRWMDFNASGADDGLSVDNFSLTPQDIVVLADPKVNEFSASTAGTDVEYVEIFGTANADYSTYKILEIEGDSGTAVGTVDEVISLGTTSANGLYLVNLAANALENGTITLLLVKNFTGALNQDLDTDNNGVFEVTPWDTMVDSIAVNDGGAGDVTYGSPALGVSYDGAPFAPGGASRIPDGFDTDAAINWVRNDFDLAGIPGFTGTPVYGEAYNTPGALNSVILPKLVINEVDYDQPSTDTAEYLEIRNNETAAVSLSGWTLELVNGASGAVVYDTITLPNVSLPAGDYYVVCANTATVSNCDLDDFPDIDFIQNGAPDAVGLRFNSTLIDAVSYEGNTAASYTEGSGVGLVDTATGAQSISRCPNGSDTNVNNIDFTLAGSTPGAANDCASLTPQLTITDVSLNEGNSGTTTFTFNVNLSIPALAGGVTFDIATADGTAQDDVPPTEDNDYVAQTLTAQSIPAGAMTYAFNILVNGNTTSETDETFFVNVTNVTGATVIDAQGLGTIVNDDGLAITFIHDIQGSGSTVTGAGPFTVEAIVVGDYQTQGSGQLRGFFLQEEDADADASAATSEGIFVFCSGCPTAVSVGDKVRVTGGASDFNDMSQLTATTAASVTLLGTGNPLPTAATIQLPVPGGPFASLAAATAAINAYYEPFEGMLVTFPDTLSVSEYFELARYGQVILSEGGRLRQFTDGNLPSTTGYVNHLINLATRRIILDDTDNRENRPVDSPNTAYYYPVPGLSTGNFFRGGDTITSLKGVLHWSFAGGPSANAWRIRPVTEAAYNYTFTPVNTRPSVPNVGGEVKVASFNVLNYFLTIDTTSGDSGPCGASMTLDCRGPDSAAERNKQQAKLTEALKGLDADVYGMIELENTPNVDPLGEIVADLNDATAPGTFAAIDTGVVGTDAIKVGLIYKPGSVTPVGAPMIDNDPIHNRPPVAQLFETPAGGRFTVVINHFKSKGCDGASGLNLDQGDGQSCFNAQRVSQAQALIDFVSDIVLTTGDPDVLIIGDLNSYAKENPITTLESAGFTNLVASLGGSGAYSYLFDSQLGYLDHALATSSLTPQVTGVADWHINADEIPLFDYNDDVRDIGEASFEEESDVLPLYEVNQFRTSDHDPVVIGLTPNAPPTVDAGGPYSVDEGSSVTLSATGSDPNGDMLTYAWDLDNNGSFETSGQSVSFLAGSLDGPSTYTVNVKATDPGGLSATNTATVTVDNVKPAVSISAPAGNLSCGTNNASYNVSFTDPGTADTHTATVDWGDSNTGSVGSVTSSFNVTHTYALVGSYTVTVAVTDDDGGTGSASITKTVNYNTSGFLQPLNPDGTSVFKYKSTIPVKIKFTDCNGTVPSNLAPTIMLTKISGSTPGLDINEPTSTSAADTSGVMRFDATGQQYIYNLATLPLPDSSATYRITVTVPSTGQTVTVNFGLKP